MGAHNFACSVDMFAKVDKIIKINLMLQQDKALKKGELEEDREVTECHRQQLESLWVLVISTDLH